jgi:HEPN domain-containing protein
VKEKAKSWLEYAQRDLAAAEKLSSDETISNIVLFHCQQCVEKALKGLFEEHDLQVPRIHSTLKLYADIRKVILSVPILAENEDFGFIDDIYLDTRYPGGMGLLPSGLPTQKETTQGLRIARQVFAAVQNLLQ